jgi:hypothetical protein
MPEKPEKPEYVIMKKKPTLTSAGTRKRYRLSKTGRRSVREVKDYFRRKLFEGPSVSRGPDGYYTWLIKETGAGLLLVAGRTRSKQEIGTLHVNMNDLTEPGDVLAAGEFIKREDHIMFNLQSGSFMKKIFTSKELRTRAARLAKRDQLVALASAEFERNHLHPTFNESVEDDEEIAGAPMIDIADIRTTLSNIAEFNAYLSGSNVSNSENA